jgi:hypothetical protein
MRCGGLEDGVPRNGMEREGKEKRERKTAVMIAWVLERKGGLLVWDSGVWSEAVLFPGEENLVAFSPPFLMAAGKGREGRPGQPVRLCWRVGWRALSGAARARPLVCEEQIPNKQQWSPYKKKRAMEPPRFK